MMIRLFQLTTIVLFCLTSYIQAHTPNPCAKQDKYLIMQPVVNMHEAASENASFVSQGLYGHSAAVIEAIDNEWAHIETEDGYRGYAKIQGLIADNPRWRTSNTLCRVSSVEGLVYPIADTELPALLKLPFGSRVEPLQDLNESHDRWLQVRLVDGTLAWMQRGDLEKPSVKTLEEALFLSKKFLERPYIWGGNSSQGFDCSGFVQTLCKQIGILLPRDSRPQAASDLVERVEGPERAGDLVFFGNTRITHVGIYLGQGNFIHSGVGENKPFVTISSIENGGYNLLASRRLKPVAFKAEILPFADFWIQQASSEKMVMPISLGDLRRVKMNHWGFDGCVHEGELIVHKKVVSDVVEIFKELFEAKYPIEKMLPISAYHYDDELSCEDNNTSAFCSRTITGSQSEWSLHSFGRAIDINPLLNPYQKNATVVPENGKPFLDRSIDCQGVITEEDPCYKAFISRGWKWGGHWQKERGYVDYQHFYKEL